MTERRKKQPWLVRMHHRMRAASFAMLFCASSLHMAGKDYSLVAWTLSGLLFLVYPHLQYWRAACARNPVETEMKSLLIDSILLGAFAAAMQFSLWLSFSAMLGTLTNNAANKGWRGVRETIAALLVGALTTALVVGLEFSPDTGWPTTLFCIVGLSGYLLAVGNTGFVRNLQLRRTREQLRQRETELLTANENLGRNLREIDALHEQLREQANRDPLTNLYNRRYLDSTLERELARCKREGQSLSLILIDIDHFKQINDTYGHQAGDEMLLRIAESLSGIARAGDVACRYGGEEFLLLMPTMTLDVALERAENLRTSFSALHVEFGDFHLQATMSIGISVYPGHATDADELIRSADRALYRAKQGGRNRIESEAVGCKVLAAACR
jgi:diguanylate cyclase